MTPGWARRAGLTAASVLPVAVAVASNQVLSNGVWNWWWTGAAVVLAAVSTLITYRLTAPSPEHIPPSEPPATADTPSAPTAGAQAPPTSDTSIPVPAPVTIVAIGDRAAAVRDNSGVIQFGDDSTTRR